MHALFSSLAFLLVSTAVLADSGTLDAAIGGGLGGATGAAIGNELGGRDGAILGGAIGGGIGAAMTTPVDKAGQVGGYARPAARREGPAGPPGHRYCPPGQAKKCRC